MSKFGNEVQDYDGYSFASKFEASIYQQLKLRKSAGEISEIQCQVTVRICGPQGHVCNSKKKVEYKPDFKCIRPDETFFFVEAKGFETAQWRNKRRYWMHYGPGDLEIWRGSYQRPYLDETIEVQDPHEPDHEL